MALNHANQKQTTSLLVSRQTAPSWQEQKILLGGGDGFKLYLPIWINAV